MGNESNFQRYRVAGLLAVAMLLVGFAVARRLRIEQVPTPSELAAARVADWNRPAALIPVTLEPTPFLVSSFCRHPGASAGWVPRAQEIARLEELIADLARKKQFPSQGEALQRYVRQYVGSSEGGRRIICLNAAPLEFLESHYELCKLKVATEEWRDLGCTPGWWRYEPIQVKDGGPDFWGVVFDPDTEQFTDFHANGSA